jgi:hypothetical protein
MSTFAEAVVDVRRLERRCEDLADRVTVLDHERMRLSEALRHAVYRTHGHIPEACGACERAQKLADEVHR